MSTPLLLLIGLVCVEALLSRYFVAAYFRFGIPLLRASVDARTHSRLPSAEDLVAISREYSRSVLTFSSLGPDEVGFRERVWGDHPRIRYTPVMRGIIRLESGRIHLIGKANWSVLAFVPFCLFSIHSQIPGNVAVQVVFTSVAIAIIAGVYVVQRRLYLGLMRSIQAQGVAATHAEGSNVHDRQPPPR